MIHKTKTGRWAVNLIPTLGVLFSLIVKEPKLTRPKSAEKWAPADSEDAQWARNQIESGIDFDILDEIRKQDSWPISYLALQREAILTTQAAAYRHGVDAFNLSIRLQRNPRAMRELWLSMKNDENRSGASDFQKTKFETFRVRPYIHPNDWKPSLFRVQRGPHTYYAGLNDPFVMRAVAWLEGEGDDSVNLAPTKQRLRNDGGYLVKLDSGKKIRKGKRKGKPITVSVWVQPDAFLPWAFEEQDNIMGDGSFSRIELKRGRKPKGKPLPNGGYLVRIRGKDIGMIVPVGQLTYEKQCNAEPRWVEPVDVVEEVWLEQLANRDEDETLVSTEVEDVDEVFETA